MAMTVAAALSVMRPLFIVARGLSEGEEAEAIDALLGASEHQANDPGLTAILSELGIPLVA